MGPWTCGLNGVCRQGCDCHRIRSKLKPPSRQVLALYVRLHRRTANGRDGNHVPTHCLPCQLANGSAGQLTLSFSGQPSLWASGPPGLRASGPLASNHAPRINQLFTFELLKGEAGEGAVIDEEDDDGSAGEGVGERDEFRPALQRLR